MTKTPTDPNRPQLPGLPWPGGATGALAYLRRQWKRALSLLGLLAFLALVGFVTHEAMEDSLQDILAKNLNAIIEADIEALRIWMDNEKRQVRLWAQREIVVDEITKLREIAADEEVAPEELSSSASQSVLRSLLQADRENSGYLIADTTGLILSSNNAAHIGRRFNSDGMAFLGKVIEEETWITHPFPDGSLVSGADVRLDVPRMMAAAKVVKPDGDADLGVLAFVIDPQEDFTRILSVARIGETGNTYAFNRHGVLLSGSRFESQLKEIGLLPNHPDAQSTLNIEIRDPGGDMTQGYKPKVQRSAQPLTRMAASAVAGTNGILLEGYRDYRGVEVLGTWRWLPEHALGVATEVSLAEARRVVRPLIITFWGLFALLVIVVLIAAIANLIIRRLRLRAGENLQIDRYTLEKKLGEGGAGEVYRARHLLLRRPTAIKLLRGDKVTTDTLERFEREVQLTSQLRHPNTIEIYDYGYTAEGIFYYVMEYLDGITLARLIEIDGAVHPARTVHILRQVCASLQEAHSVGLIHRDIKPLNIVLCRMGGEPDFVKVFDFGLAREIEIPEDQSVTATQVITGTPLYIAPERLRDPKNVDARCDIYSIGVVGYNLLTGKDLFDGANALELSHHTLHSPPPRPSERSTHQIPPELDQLILNCLEKDPEARPSSAREVIDRLDAIDLRRPWDWQSAISWWESHEEILNEAPIEDPGSTTPTPQNTRTIDVEGKKPVQKR